MNDEAHIAPEDDINEVARHEAPLCPEASSVAQRIAAERDKLTAEEVIERTLTTKRKTLLVEGSDGDVDECERAIDASRGAQVRILERIELLAPQVAQANERFRATELDAVAQRADRARQFGEKLIRNEIAKALAVLAPELEKLAAVEQFITAANHRLQRAGRQLVDSPNAIRCRRTRRWTEKERRQVGLGEREHPNFNDDYIRTSDGERASLRQSGESIPMYTEVEVDVKRTELGDFPSALQELVIPDIGPAPDGESLRPLWSGAGGTVRQEVRDHQREEGRRRIQDGGQSGSDVGLIREQQTEGQEIVQ